MNRRKARIQEVLLSILLLSFGMWINPIKADAANIVLVEIGDFSVEGDVLIPGSDTTVSLGIRM